MRSDTQPQNWRLTKAVPNSTDNIAAPCEARMPRSLQSAGRCACGMAIGMQQKMTAAATRTNTRLGGQPITVLGADAVPERAARSRHLRRRAQEDRRQRDDHDDLEQAVIEHGLPPAGIGDGALEDRRPDRAGDVAAARNQRQRRAAAAIEPAADIDVERRVHAADAEKSHEQALADIELPGSARRSRAQARRRSSPRRTSPSSARRPFRRCSP